MVDINCQGKDGHTGEHLNLYLNKIYQLSNLQENIAKIAGMYTGYTYTTDARAPLNHLSARQWRV